MIEKRIRAAVLGCLIGDATALGYHWIYDTNAIPQGDGTQLSFEAPRAKWHNPSTTPGSFTHYGAQAELLLGSLLSQTEASACLDLDVFWVQWKAFWSQGNPASELLYRDGATTNTLNNIALKGDSPREAGSDSHDFSVVGRVIAPLLLAFRERTAYISACRDVAAVTHKTNALVLASVAFFADVLFSIVHSEENLSATNAIKDALNNPNLLPDFRALIEQGVLSVQDLERTSTEIVGKFGPACSVEGALPSTIHLLVRYDGNVAEALKRNIACGGDNAARASVVGSILGAAQGDLGEAESLVDQLRKQHPVVGRVGL